MRFRRKTKKIVLVSVSVLLAVGTIVVCIVGEMRLNEENKKYSGAKEVISRNVYDEIYK